MSKLIDLTGQVIGNWKVIERAKSLGSPHGKKSTSWKCQCVKNPEYIVVKRSQELRKITKETCRSCKGCHESDLSGKQFGRWRVINKADDYVDSKGRAYHMWNCECSCEKHTRRAVLAKNLIRGTTKSCGCIPAD